MLTRASASGPTSEARIPVQRQVQRGRRPAGSARRLDGRARPAPGRRGRSTDTSSEAQVTEMTPLSAPPDPVRRGRQRRTGWQPAHRVLLRQQIKVEHEGSVRSRADPPPATPRCDERHSRRSDLGEEGEGAGHGALHEQRGGDRVDGRVGAVAPRRCTRSSPRASRPDGEREQRRDLLDLRLGQLAPAGGEVDQPEPASSSGWPTACAGSPRPRQLAAGGGRRPRSCIRVDDQARLVGRRPPSSPPADAVDGLGSSRSYAPAARTLPRAKVRRAPPQPPCVTASRPTPTLTADGSPGDDPPSRPVDPVDR